MWFNWLIFLKRFFSPFCPSIVFLQCTIHLIWLYPYFTCCFFIILLSFSPSCVLNYYCSLALSSCKLLFFFFHPGDYCYLLLILSMGFLWFSYCFYVLCRYRGDARGVTAMLTCDSTTRVEVSLPSRSAEHAPLDFSGILFTQ